MQYTLFAYLPDTELRVVPLVAPLVVPLVVPWGTLSLMLGSGMLTSGSGTTNVSVGMVAVVVGTVVGAVVGLAVVDGVVAGALLAQLHAHRHSDNAKPIIKMAIFLI